MVATTSATTGSSDVSSAIAAGTSTATTDGMNSTFMAQMNAIQAQGMEMEVVKAQRDVQNSFTTGLQGSVTEEVSSATQNKIQY